MPMFPDAGTTIIAVTNDRQELAERIVEDVSDFTWELRGPLAKRKLPKPEEGVAKALEMVRSGIRPVVIADHSDRTGDGTHILEQLLKKGAKNFGVSTIADPRAVRKIKEKAKVGDIVTVKVGGYEKLSGNSVELTGKVKFLEDCSYIRTGPMGRGSRTNLGPTA